MPAKNIIRKCCLLESSVTHNGLILLTDLSIETNSVDPEQSGLGLHRLSKRRLNILEDDKSDEICSDWRFNG